jgi:hypothetical protein
MGYSGRYHAASLAAVFIALAIGILIGIGLADDVVSSASEELETSLRSDLSDAENRADDLQAQVDRGDRFSDQVLTPLLSERLAGQRVALIEFGDVPDELAADARRAVETAGGDLSSIARIARPPDAEALIDALPPRFAKLRRDPDQLTALGKALGTGIARNGPIVEVLKPDVFESFTGNLQGADRVILARSDTDDLDAGEREATNTFEDAVIAGIDDRALATVGAELTTMDPSTLGPFVDAGLPTVDHLDLAAGQVSLVYALDGIDGNYGVKDEASSFLPDFERSPATAGTP